ncbi:MAG: class I SAM-dependent methyltransferase [Candidatus Bathyarchaeia archaeon]
MFNKAYGYILRHPATRRGYWGNWYYRGRYERVLRRLTEFCQRDRTIMLELGCGSGVYASYLGKTRSRCHYVGCDVERKPLRFAYRGKDTDYVLCDIHKLPFSPKCANIILCSEVFEHIPAPYSTLESICELRAETLIITFPEERLLYLLKDRHPEHTSAIDRNEIVRTLLSKKLTIIINSQIFTSYIPCGILEFLSVPRNNLTMNLVDVVDRLLKKIMPASMVPHRTIMIEATRADPS